MRAHPLPEARLYADMMLDELRKVIPSFLKRIDRPERGGEWSEYFDDTRRGTAAVAADLLGGAEPEPRPPVTLVDFDPDGEIKVVAAAVYAASSLPEDQIVAKVRAMTAGERARILDAAVGDRRNRRHKPGRAFERTNYRFDVVCDYGAFRDLQRHRMLTIEWQDLTPAHGYEVPEAVVEAGVEERYHAAMARSAQLYEALSERFPHQAAYAVSLAYRIRFVMQVNAREAMHMLELRSTPQGHPSYRRVAQEMHHLIREQAGHRALADAMRFVDHREYDLERLEAERAAEVRRAGRG